VRVGNGELDAGNWVTGAFLFALDFNLKDPLMQPDAAVAGWCGLQDDIEDLAEVRRGEKMGHATIINKRVSRHAKSPYLHSLYHTFFLPPKFRGLFKSRVQGAS
jgi:hypothetical protein